MKDGTKFRRFLVIDIMQLILVEPDSKRLGWGIAKLVGFLQDVEVAGDKEDSRCLHLTIHRGGATTNRTPILSAKFLFDDHIRCMAAKQRLTKGRTKARQKKMFQIAQLLEIPGQGNDAATLSIYSATANLRTSNSSQSQQQQTQRIPREHRPLFSTTNRVPGFAAALRRESMPSGSVSRVQLANRSMDSSSSSSSMDQQTMNVSQPKRKLTIASAGSNRRDISSSRSRDGSKNRCSTPRSRESSPRLPRPRSEEIPLEDFRRSQNSSPVSSRPSSGMSSRSHTPSRFIPEEKAIIVTKETYSSTFNPANQMLSKEIKVPTIVSEETSFIASEQDKLQKKKGVIETV